jgi:hypothetical protein
VFTFALKAADVMMRLTCDVHSWMHGYIGVVAHPYFAVSGGDGAFTIANVPAGRHTIRMWHERFGEMTRTVTVTGGRVTNLDANYDAAAKPKAARVVSLQVPAPTE